MQFAVDKKIRQSQKRFLEDFALFFQLFKGKIPDESVTFEAGKTMGIGGRKRIYGRNETMDFRPEQDRAPGC